MQAGLVSAQCAGSLIESDSPVVGAGGGGNRGILGEFVKGLARSENNLSIMWHVGPVRRLIMLKFWVPAADI